MTLTNKCLEDFETYIENATNISSMYSFRSMPMTCKMSMVIEFFDSVGITILLDTCEGYFYFVIKETLSNTHVSNCKKYFQEEDDSKTRNEATNHAIAKANEIYNSKEK